MLRILMMSGIAVLALAARANADIPQRAAVRDGLSQSQCEALAREDFSQLQDAPSGVMSAEFIASAGAAPGYCEVIGRTWRDVGFRVRLPLRGWNEKLVVFGTGGQAGGFRADDPVSTVSNNGSALRQGFATATHNGGHVSREIDASWALENEPALLDYGFRAPHVAGLIARDVAARAYGRGVRLAYYSGCSNGGREALHMAQSYPDDYDGIIAGAPSMRWSELFAHLHWFASRMYREAAVLDGRALSILHRHVLARCDDLDGARDAILDDLRRCAVDLAAITCRRGMRANCLTPDQAQAAREIYDGPHDADGRRVTFSSAMPGSELVWDDFAGIEAYPPSVFRYQSFMPAAGADFVPDERQLSDYIRRSGCSDAILSADNPDLRRFRDRGGKLLSYMGWNDPLGGVLETIDYYTSVERLIGGAEATQEFYRLFTAPGMNHCTGGDGAYQIDWLAALDAWVDQGAPPDSIAGYHPDANGNPLFSRNLGPFSTQPIPENPAGDTSP